MPQSTIPFARRQPQGAWAYGEADHHRWTDGFHTGYVIEALQLCRPLLKRDDLAEPIARGLNYYRSAFLRDDGVVPYYSDGKGPLDANNFAQMTITLHSRAAVARLVAISPTKFWLRQSGNSGARELDAFAYQRSGGRINRTIYPRWTQIWMMHALGLQLEQK